MPHDCILLSFFKLMADICISISYPLQSDESILSLPLWFRSLRALSLSFIFHASCGPSSSNAFRA